MNSRYLSVPLKICLLSYVKYKLNRSLEKYPSANNGNHNVRPNGGGDRRQLARVRVARQERVHVDEARVVRRLVPVALRTGRVASEARDDDVPVLPIVKFKRNSDLSEQRPDQSTTSFIEVHVSG